MPLFPPESVSTKENAESEMMSLIRVLIVEENEKLSRQIAAAMLALEYAAVIVPDADAGLKALGETGVQIIVADSCCGGMQLTDELRSAGDVLPVILLTGDDSRGEKRRIFRCGADGYMTLPLDLEELQMRVQSLLWRCRIVDSAQLRFGSCTLHSGALTLETPQGEIELRHMEFLLLEKLLSYPGRVFTRAQLMDEIWGYDSESDPRTVDTHIRRLRKKLHDVEDIRLQTVRGLGYRAAMPRRLRRAENGNERTDAV